MRQILLLILIFMLLIPSAALGETAYEHWVPEEAVAISQIDAGGLKIITYDIPATGEQITLTADSATGEIRMLYGMCSDVSGEIPMDTSTAKTLLTESYPDALIISSSEETVDIGKVRRLNIFAESFYGYVLFDAEKICCRDLTFTTCMQNGRLNMQGVVSIMKLLRPEAVLSGIELDEDDGLLLYEGDAHMDGVEYEFELDAYTGQLLQWDRD